MQAKLELLLRAHAICHCSLPARFVFTLKVVSLYLHFQYKTGEDGSVVGVTVTRRAVLAHCRALTQACSYIEG